MIYEFSGNILNTERHVLTRNGQQVAVEPQVFDILRLLAENAGVLVTKDQLIDDVWNGRIVSEATVSARINAARNAVGDNGTDQAIIRTVPRRGFEMVAQVSVAEPVEPVAAKHTRQTIRYTRSPDGTSIAWSSAGEGPPLLLAWHHLSHLELDWSSDLLHGFIHGMAKGRKVVRFDIRGSGLSDPMKPGDAIDAHVDDMMAVADAAGLDQFAIAAVLQASAVAIRAAVRYPDRISRMALNNAYSRGRSQRGEKLEKPEHDPFIALIKGGGWGDADDAFMRAWMTMSTPSASQSEITELIGHIYSTGSAEDALLQREWIDNLDVTADLENVTCPTLVVHSRLCAIHPAQEGRRVAAGIPDAEFLEVDSSNTICISSDPTLDYQVRMMREFLEAEG